MQKKPLSNLIRVVSRRTGWPKREGGREKCVVKKEEGRSVNHFATSRPLRAKPDQRRQIGLNRNV